jgi:hypothetical protein
MLKRAVQQSPSNFLYLSLGEWPGCPLLRTSNDMHPPSKLARFLSWGWGLTDLPLRASNEGLLRPRVARAQKIIRLHPLLCSASKKGTWSLPPLLADIFSILLGIFN